MEPLSQDEEIRIADLPQTNDALQIAFERYEANPKSIDLIVNLSLGQLPKPGIGAFEPACRQLLAGHVDNGLTMDEVLGLLRTAGYHDYIGKQPRTATLQMISVNHELRGRDFVVRSYKTLAS